MKRFLLTLILILFIPKLLIAEDCNQNLSYTWKLLGTNKVSFSISNNAYDTDIKISKITLKDFFKNNIQTHYPDRLIKRSEYRVIIFDLEKPYDQYQYASIQCKTEKINNDINPKENTIIKENSKYWSNVKSGPDSFKKAKNLLKNIDKNSIEGIWRYPEGFTTVIIKEKDLFREYVIDARANYFKKYIGTLEATYIKTGNNKYKFYQRVFYTGNTSLKEHTMVGMAELKSGYSLNKDYFELSKTGLNMDQFITKVYPENSVLVDETKNEYTQEQVKDKYTPQKFGNKKNKYDKNITFVGIFFFLAICLLLVVRVGIISAKSSNKKTVISPSINSTKEKVINNKKAEKITKENDKKEIIKENKPIKVAQKKKIKVIAERPFIDLIQSLKYKDKLSLDEFNMKSQSEKKKIYDLYNKIYSFFMDRFRSEAKVETYFKSQNGKTTLLGWQVVSKGVFEYSVVETISYFLNLDETITPEIAVICIQKYSEKLNEEKDIESKVKGILGVKAGDLGTSKEKCIFIRYKVETEMNKFIFEKKMNINWKILKEFLDNRSKSPMS